MALFEVVLKSVYAGQQCINRWNYSSTGTPAAVSTSFALASAMGCIASGTPPVFPALTMFEKIRDITAEEVEFNEIMVMNIYDLADFYTTAFPDNTFGRDSTGTAKAPFEAAGFRTNLVTRAVARGTKRFVGVSDAWVGVNGALNPDYIAKMEILAEAMRINLTYNDEGNNVSFAPLIVSKEKTVLPNDKVRRAYYPTLTEQMQHVALGIRWEAYDTVRSQTSRQVGHGK